MSFKRVSYLLLLRYLLPEEKALARATLHFYRCSGAEVLAGVLLYDKQERLLATTDFLGNASLWLTPATLISCRKMGFVSKEIVLPQESRWLFACYPCSNKQKRS